MAETMFIITGMLICIWAFLGIIIFALIIREKIVLYLQERQVRKSADEFQRALNYFLKEHYGASDASTRGE